MSAVEQPTMGEVVRGLIRIEAKLDHLATDHEQRIRANEKWRWGLVGATSATLISAVGALLQAYNIL